MMKIGRTILVVLLSISMVQAQGLGKGGAVSGDEVIRCYTVEMEAQRKALQPGSSTDAEFEAWMANEIAQQRLNPSSQRAMASRVIPTVVHVIYSNAGENISAAQVQSQIDVLNEDFQRLNADAVNTPAAFLPAAVDSDIEFCLAQIDPTGNPTTGINRVSMAGSPFTTGQIDANIKPATQWDPNNYFNIWVVNITGGVLGYAQFPEAAGLAGIGTGNGAANTDGVVLLTSSVGRPPFNTSAGPYNLGRTATHEVGHWLGLRHIWGDGGCGVDDFCADTPASDASNFGCNPAHVSCGSTDMVQNYMDYTDDACMNLFTADQKTRMDVVMSSSPRRASLLASNVCNLTPEITYVTATSIATESSSSGTSGCRGYQDVDISLRIGGPPTGAATVTLTNVGGSLVQGVDYDVLVGAVVFPNGVTGNQNFRIRLYDDAAVEAIENLTIGFAISGTTDAYAGTQNQHTITLNDNDLGPAFAGTSVFFTEDFESGANGWTVPIGTGANQWVVAGPNGAMSGTGSCYISRNANANQYNANQTSNSLLASPAINATGVFNLSASFDFHSNGEAGYDFGVLYYSLDGANWTLFDGTAATTPFQGVTANTNYSVTLPAACENTTFYLGFYWVNDNSVGNNPPFAIDDVSISGSAPIAVETTLGSTNSEYLGPNSTVYWYEQSTGDVMLRIDNATNHDYGCTDVTIDRAGTGATLYQASTMPYACTDKTFRVNPTNNNPSGTYTVRLYFNATEVAGWETATAQARGVMNVAKTGGPISNITPATPLANGPTNYYGTTPSTSAYNTTDFWVEAEFTSGFSGFAGGVENTTLPVEFLSIDARWEAADAVVEWEVGDFSNLRHFIVDRSVDGGTFMEVGTRLSDESSGNGATFSFNDTQANRLEGQQLKYRVRGIDFDGSEVRSDVRELRLSGTAIVAWPNPFETTFQVSVQLDEAQNLQLKLVNPLGQVISQTSQRGQTGNNVISPEGLDGLAPGIYFLDLQVGGVHHLMKVVKGE